MMAEFQVLNWKKSKVSTVAIKDSVFGLKSNPALFHEIVSWQQARKRQGTHKSKTRSESRGGGRKPFVQKGTGNARQGSIRSPLLEGGATVHGPKPRSYDWAFLKEKRKLALKQALSYLFLKKKLFVVESMTSSEGKTKELSKRFHQFGLKKALLVDVQKEESFSRACKNLKRFKFVSVDGVTVYDLLKFDCLVITPKSIESIIKKCEAS